MISDLFHFRFISFIVTLLVVYFMSDLFNFSFPLFLVYLPFNLVSLLDYLISRLVYSWFMFLVVYFDPGLFNYWGLLLSFSLLVYFHFSCLINSCLFLYLLHHSLFIPAFILIFCLFLIMVIVCGFFVFSDLNINQPLLSSGYRLSGHNKQIL